MCLSWIVELGTWYQSYGDDEDKGDAAGGGRTANVRREANEGIDQRVYSQHTCRGSMGEVVRVQRARQQRRVRSDSASQAMEGVVVTECWGAGDLMDTHRPSPGHHALRSLMGETIMVTFNCQIRSSGNFSGKEKTFN